MVDIISRLYPIDFSHVEDRREETRVLKSKRPNGRLHLTDTERHRPTAIACPLGSQAGMSSIRPFKRRKIKPFGTERARHLAGLCERRYAGSFVGPDHGPGAPYTGWVPVSCAFPEYRSCFTWGVLHGLRQCHGQSG